VHVREMPTVLPERDPAVHRRKDRTLRGGQVMKVAADRRFRHRNLSHGVMNAVFLLRVPDCVPKSPRETPVSPRETRRDLPFVQNNYYEYQDPFTPPALDHVQANAKIIPSHISQNLFTETHEKTTSIPVAPNPGRRYPHRVGPVELPRHTIEKWHPLLAFLFNGTAPVAGACA